MDWAAIENQMLNLPSGYTRPGKQFAWMIQGFVAALYRGCNAQDGLVNELNFSAATGPWLDAWGKLFYLPRNSQESDDSYMNRITATLNAGRSTPNAILFYLKNSLGVQATITEDFTHCSWSLVFSQPLPQATYAEIAQNLVYVRPAGVPFLPFQVLKGGLYLGTINFLGAPSVTGSYLANPVTDITPSIASFTDNALPLIPTVFLTDPTLNPSLAA